MQTRKNWILKIILTPPNPKPVAQRLKNNGEEVAGTVLPCADVTCSSHKNPRTSIEELQSYYIFVELLSRVEGILAQQVLHGGLWLYMVRSALA